MIQDHTFNEVMYMCVYIYGTLDISLWEPGCIVDSRHTISALSPDQVEAWTKLA